MAERKVQVPESLIERIESLLRTSDDRYYRETGRALAALLSQPTPTAGACICTFGPDTDGPNIDCPIHGQWPSITDMMPGTTFTAEFHGERDIFFRCRDSLARAGRYLVSMDALDPSTIRDVTLPKDPS